MRTSIVIDDKLLEEAMEATGAKTTREVVELGLSALIGLDEEVTLAWAKEVSRRQKELRAGTAKATPWAEARKRHR